jgi:hypothetical protein
MSATIKSARRSGIVRIKSLVTMIGLVMGFLLFMGAQTAAQAEDEWAVLAEQTIKAADQGAELKSSGGQRDQNVKEVKVSVDGADVNIKKLVLHFDNAGDKEVTDIGTLKAGGSSLPIEAPGRKGQLKSTTVTYEVTGADSAVLKIWGR